MSTTFTTLGADDVNTLGECFGDVLRMADHTKLKI